MNRIMMPIFTATWISLTAGWCIVLLKSATWIMALH
jgi:hypothetical protein